MVPVKIGCECGQNYAFEVEPVNGRMPAGVTCPSCGADGTSAANDFIAQQFAPAATEAASSPEPAQLATARPTAAADARRGRLDTAKAEKEARARMMWGESMQQVAAYLTVQGFSRAEAAELTKKLFHERTLIVRSNGIKKIVAGLVLILVPVLAFFLIETTGRIRIRLTLVCYGIGIYGAYLLVCGIINIIVPNSEQGAFQKE